MAKTAQARDKTGLWSHSAPDSRKHDFLRGQDGKHCKTRVLGRSRSEPGGGGPGPMGCWENNDLALKNKVLLRFWSLSGKVGGCRPLKN